MQIDWLLTAPLVYVASAVLFNTVFTFWAAAAPRGRVAAWVNQWDGKEEYPPWVLLVLFWPFIAVFKLIEAGAYGPHWLGKKLHERIERKHLPKAKLVDRE